VQYCIVNADFDYNMHLVFCMICLLWLASNIVVHSLNSKLCLESGCVVIGRKFTRKLSIAALKYFLNEVD
jgi:hypothetical protein